MDSKMENSRSKLLIVTLTVLLLLFYWSFIILGSGFNSKHNSEAQYQNKLQLSVIVSLVSMFQSKTCICSIGILFYLSINIPVTILTNNIFTFFPENWGKFYGRVLWFIIRHSEKFRDRLYSFLSVKGVNSYCGSRERTGWLLSKRKNSWIYFMESFE